MGIGRRNFLKLVSLSFAGILLDPLKAVAINGNVYVNKKLGILFYKPDSWGFIGVKDFGKIKAEQFVGEGLDMEIDEIWQELGDPICLMTKYYQDIPEYKGIFSPTITLNITPKEELAYLNIVTFEELIAMSHAGTSKVLKDFKVIKQYEPYFISGTKFYEFDAEYMFEHIKMNEPLKVELKSFKAEHNGFYYDFNCHQSKSVHQVADTEFAAFKKTIRFI